MHKTGSTSIQESLRGFQNDKFYYADLGDSNHSIPIYCLFSQKPEKHHALRGLSKEQIEKRKITIREKLIKSINDAGNRILIISGEDISLLSEEELRNFKSFLVSNINENIKITGYIRNPYEFISSAFQQILKARFITLDELDKVYPNYKNRFEKFFKVFGGERVILKKYDPARFPDNDVVLDFCNTFGIEISKDRIKRVNESFPKEIVSLLYIFRKYKNNVSLKPPQIQFLGESLKNLFQGLKLTKFRINSSLIKQIVDKNLEDVRWIEERLGESLLDETIEKIEGIKSEEDIMELRKDLIERLTMYIDYFEPNINYKPEEIADIVLRYFKKITENTFENIHKIYSLEKKNVIFVPDYEIKIHYNLIKEIEFIKLDTLHIDLLNNGNLIIGGLILLKKDVDGIYKLIAKINNEEQEVKWGLPSPMLAAKYPDNPKAREARFQLVGLSTLIENIEIRLNESKIIEIELFKK